MYEVFLLKLRVISLPNVSLDDNDTNIGADGLL
jgi:hypothetical protein